jgi:lysophospholipase L1-like esterase
MENKQATPMGNMPTDPMEIFKAMSERERQDKINRFRVLNQTVKKGETLFTGSSLMEQFPINELAQDFDVKTIIYNRGIGGYTTDDMLAHMDEQIFAVEPSRIFINIGTNDIGMPINTFEENLSHMLTNYREILTQIKKRLPEAEVFLMAYYPVNENAAGEDAAEYLKYMFKNRTNENILKANAGVEKLAAEFGYHYIDVNDGLRDENGRLKKEFTIEGIHMYANGYCVVLENMRKYL